MLNNSWMLVAPENAEQVLPNAIREADGFYGRDVGWVTQMLPFIEAFSSERDVVLDPFAGLGTTLVAAHSLNRQAKGIEIDIGRIALIRERWRLKNFQADSLNVYAGDCATVLRQQPAQSIDLCASSVPYFGSSWSAAGEANQLYASQSYEAYLNYLQQVFMQLRRVIKPNGMIVLMAENVRTPSGCLLPIAWDIAAKLSAYFTLYDERVLLYTKACDDTEPSKLKSNRAHEYAIIARHELVDVNDHDVDHLLSQLNALELTHCIYGSYACKLRGETIAVSDLDLLIPDTIQNWQKAMTLLKQMGYLLHSWDQPVSGEINDAGFPVWRKRRVMRCLNRQGVRQLDLTFIAESVFEALPKTANKWRHVANDIQFDEQWLPQPKER